MRERRRARLVKRVRNNFHGGPCELWDIGGGRGIYVDFDPHGKFGTRGPNTFAFQLDMERHIVTNWDESRYWQGDATGGKAIRELGYEIVEDER